MFSVYSRIRSIPARSCASEANSCGGPDCGRGRSDRSGRLGSARKSRRTARSWRSSLGRRLAASQPRSARLRGTTRRRAGPLLTTPGPPPRAKLEMTLDLPVGSEPGHYNVELQQPDGQTVARTSGTANLVNGLTVLKIRIDTRGARTGNAWLRVRPPERSWSRYAVHIR
jgi:hypothetical protein